MCAGGGVAAPLVALLVVAASSFAADGVSAWREPLETCWQHEESSPLDLDFRLEPGCNDDGDPLSLVQLRVKRRHERHQQPQPQDNSSPPNSASPLAVAPPLTKSATRQAAAEDALRAADLANRRAIDRLAAAGTSDRTPAQASEAAEDNEELNELSGANDVAERRAARKIRGELLKAESVMSVKKIEHRLKEAVMEQHAQKLKARIVDAEAEQKLEDLDDKALEQKKETLKNAIASAGSLDVEEAAVEDQLDEAVTEDQVDARREERASRRTAKLKSELATVKSEASAQRMQDRLTEAAVERETKDLKQKLHSVHEGRSKEELDLIMHGEKKSTDSSESRLLEREVASDDLGRKHNKKQKAGRGSERDPLEQAAEEAEEAADEAEAEVEEAQHGLAEEAQEVARQKRVQEARDFAEVAHAEGAVASLALKALGTISQDVPRSLHG